MKEILENFNLDEHLFPLPARSEKKRFLLEKNEDWELVLMIWGPDSKSPIHDHGGSSCWARLLKGHLTEKTFFKQNLLLVFEANLELHKINFVDKDEGVHQLTNSSNEMAYTIHLYSKPLGLCNVYDEFSKVWSQMSNVYDQHQGLSL